MRSINKRAEKVMNVLVEGLDTNNHSRKIDNNPPTSGYMPVSVNFLISTAAGDLFSIAQYHEQDTDLMADPDMTILRGKDSKYYPVAYRQDSLGIAHRCVQFSEEGDIKSHNPRTQRDTAVFAGKWLMDIKQQQGL